MDNETFLKRLGELAELEPIKVPRSAGLRLAEEAQDIIRQGKTFTIEVDENPTLNVRIKKLKTKPKQCEDCGKLVEDRRVHTSLYQNPQQHWRSRCHPCNMTLNPTTGQYDLNNKAVQTFFIQHFYKRK